MLRTDELTPGRGVAALVAGRQIAIFLLSSGEVYAIDNHDPFSGANVMSRGIVGDRDGVPKVSSPMYKQSFDLRTGRCLDDDTVAVATYPVRISDGLVVVEVEADEVDVDDVVDEVVAEGAAGVGADEAASP